MRRTEACYGQRIAKIRAELELTQADLAKQSGYSERLIRKAESSQSITFSAIKDIAAALSVNGIAVHAEDLICNPMKLAKQFMRAFAHYEAEMAQYVEHFIAENFELFCAGDPAIVPFAGKWHGIEGLDQWARRFFGALMRPQKDFYKPVYLADNDTVVAWGQDWAHVPDIPHPPIWVMQKFVFSKGKLGRFENLFDTDSGSQHLVEARAKKALEA